MKQVKRRILMVSTAAVLAGTVMAAGQGAPDRKEGGASAQQPGISQSQPKGAQQGQQREQRGNQVQREPSQREQSKPSTSGQAPREEQNRAQDNQRGQEEKRAPAQTQRQQDQKRSEGQNQRGQEQNRTEGRAEQGSKANAGTSSVNLSTEQRTKLRQTVIEGRGAPRVGKVDFSVTEGTVIPRSVHVVAVPQTLVEIHPEWRGYRYFVYNDEIIIVEPDTLRIVAIVEV